MINLDDELAEEYLAECREHLDTVDTDLMAMEKGAAELDEELINRLFRALHSVKGGAGFFDLVKVRELAHQMEEAMAQIRSRKIVPTPNVVRVLLGANDRLSETDRGSWRKQRGGHHRGAWRSSGTVYGSDFRCPEPRLRQLLSAACLCGCYW